MPSFFIKLDACPGRLNESTTIISRLGTFFGQCSEICGINHSFMPIYTKIVPMANFFLLAIEQYPSLNVPVVIKTEPIIKNFIKLSLLPIITEPVIADLFTDYECRFMSEDRWHKINNNTSRLFMKFLHALKVFQYNWNFDFWVTSMFEEPMCIHRSKKSIAGYRYTLLTNILDELWWIDLYVNSFISKSFSKTLYSLRVFEVLACSIQSIYLDPSWWDVILDHLKLFRDKADRAYFIDFVKWRLIRENIYATFATLNTEIEVDRHFVDILGLAERIKFMELYIEANYFEFHKLGYTLFEISPELYYFCINNFTDIIEPSLGHNGLYRELINGLKDVPSILKYTGYLFESYYKNYISREEFDLICDTFATLYPVYGSIAELKLFYELAYGYDKIKLQNL